LKQQTSQQAVAGQNVGQAPPNDPDAQRSKQARNKASNIRNWSKVENYLMEIEKVHGYARSWALRERLEQGQVSLDELKQR
jgi:hypothetical protein